MKSTTYINKIVRENACSIQTAEVYPKEAQTLRAEAKRSYPTRVKIADYAFRLHL